MYNFKITTCPTKYAHDWTSCPYAHSGESARRREPSMYKPIPCPESKGGNPCPRGDSCKYAHNDFEYWLHPARYKTEYCKQGPGCRRKICFFAHRPEEIRTAPTVVFTKQGPFIDSATTARNKQRSEIDAEGACPMPSSPWTRGSLNIGEQLAALNSIQNGQYPQTGQNFQRFGSARSITSTPRGVEEGGQGMSDIQAALNALTFTSTPTTPFGDVSPLTCHTPTQYWSSNQQSTYNPFARIAADTLGNNSSKLLTYLHGLQKHHLSQTPRSFADYYSPRQSLSSGGFQAHPAASASWSSDLLSFAHIMSSDAPGDQTLYSSLSDGVIHRGGPTPGSLLFNDTAPTEL